MTRVFSVDQANRALPLVRRIAEDIVVQYRRWQEKVREFEMVTSQSTAEAPDHRAERLQREVQELAAEIDGYIGELTDLGVEFKDYERGLVDFPGERDGRPVYLCWQLGEPEVRFWHELEAGFLGRQPIDPGARPSPDLDQPR